MKQGQAGWCGAMKCNDFNSDLAFSHSAEDNEMWLRIYKKAFPGMLGMANNRGDGQLQRFGIDRTLVLSSGKAIYIDEKVRRKDYGDILLEYISNDRTNSPGWVEKPLFCDYIAYAIIPSGMCYLLPVPQLQAAWAQNKEEWIAQFGSAPALNLGYKTINCPVSVNVLYRAIGEMLRVFFEPGTAQPLPQQ